MLSYPTLQSAYTYHTPIVTIHCPVISYSSLQLKNLTPSALIYPHYLNLTNPYSTLPYPSSPTHPYPSAPFLFYPTIPFPTNTVPTTSKPQPYPTPSQSLTLRYKYPTNFTPTLPPLSHYPTLLWYVRLGKDKRYGGMVLGKDRFSRDVRLHYSIQSVIMSTQYTCRYKSTSVFIVRLLRM